MASTCSMRRRDFIALLGGAAVMSPFSASAQRAGKVYRIGLLSGNRSTPVGAEGIPAIIDELKKLGFIEGQNLIVDHRSTNQDASGLFADAAELVRLKADLLMALGPEVALQAAIAASPTVPIVIMANNYDPIARSYVKSLAQPGGNITGVVSRQPELAEKQVELLTQAFPDKARLAMLWDSLSADQFEAAERRAKSLRLDVRPLKLENPPYEFGAAFRTLADAAPQMLLVLSSPFFNPQARVAQLANQYRLPAMYIFKTYVAVGGLMSYGTNIDATYRRAGAYAAKILSGAKPADLPVEQATKYELAVNLKTAKAIGVELPTSILLRADDVIE